MSPPRLARRPIRRLAAAWLLLQRPQRPRGRCACRQRPHDNPAARRYYDCFSTGDNLHIVMEHCDLGDLASQLKARAAEAQLLSEADVLLWFVQICQALQHVHQRGILHRDLKTCNIFCTSSNLVKLGDFGISKVGSSQGAVGCRALQSCLQPRCQLPAPLPSGGLLGPCRSGRTTSQPAACAAC
jgi:serine/threonine protein kinase